MEDKQKPARRRYKDGNDDGKGSYKVGRNKPPEEHRFKTGDGRKRGRRAKGTRNFDTDFQEEACRKVPVRQNGKERLESQQRATIIRLFDNAYAKGQNQAIALAFAHLARLEDKRSQHDALSQVDEQLIDAWLAMRSSGQPIEDEPGDSIEDDEREAEVEDEDDDAEDEQ
jgi:hypothetical protein